MYDLEVFQKFGKDASHCIVNGDRAKASANNHDNRLVSGKSQEFLCLILVTGQQFLTDRGACKHGFSFWKML